MDGGSDAAVIKFFNGEVLPTLHITLPTIWIDGSPFQWLEGVCVCVSLSPGGKHNRKFDYRIM